MEDIVWTKVLHVFVPFVQVVIRLVFNCNCQILRSLNSPKLPMNLAARLAKKGEARSIFMLGAEEESLHNIEDLIDTGEYALSLLRKGEIPRYIQ
ncbi:hypothetical protein MKW92_004384 [Papaver armeniacum]|nr:hypothetical protein MKW92_004384 [Papaver armeniacum]